MLSSLRPFLQASNSFSCLSFVRGDPIVCSVYCYSGLQCVHLCFVNCGLLQFVLESKGLLHVIQQVNRRFPTVYRTAADCREVIGIAARYSSVSRTTEEGQQQFVLEPALLNLILKSVGLPHTVLVSVGQLGAVVRACWTQMYFQQDYWTLFLCLQHCSTLLQTQQACCTSAKVQKDGCSLLQSHQDC